MSCRGEGSVFLLFFYVSFGSCAGTVVVVGLTVDSKQYVMAVAQNQQVGGSAGSFDNVALFYSSFI
jgi:hypothetical protein